METFHITDICQDVDGVGGGGRGRGGGGGGGGGAGLPKTESHAQMCTQSVQMGSW